MLKLTKNITIKAAPERVFEYLAEPKNLLGIWPSMVEVSEVEKNSFGAHDFSWVYKMAGFHFRGRSRTVELTTPKLHVMKNEGGIPSTFRWNFKGSGNTCEVVLEVEYSIPTPIIGKLAEHIVHKMNEREAETLLLNLKSVIEGLPKESETYARA